MRKAFLSVILVSFVGVTFSSSLAYGKKFNSRFSGYDKDDSSVSLIIGEPMLLRYKSWKSWNWGMFYDFGYQFKDEVLLGTAGFHYYFLSEDDRWRSRNRVGTVFYSSYLGALLGQPIGDDPNEKTRVGLKAGGAFEYLFPSSQLSLRFEVGPVVFISGKNVAGIHGGVGIVYRLESERRRAMSTPSAKDDFESYGDDQFDGVFEGDDGDEQFDGVFEEEPRVKKLKKRRKIKRKSRQRKKRLRRPSQPKSEGELQDFED